MNGLGDFAQFFLWGFVATDSQTTFPPEGRVLRDSASLEAAAGLHLSSHPAPPTLGCWWGEEGAPWAPLLHPHHRRADGARLTLPTRCLSRHWG